MARIGIIGAGASGVYCAIMLLQRLKRFNKQAEVELIEQNSLIARRLLVSGNGRCNLLPSFLSMDGFFGASKKVIEVFLKALPQKNQEDFFNDLGILLKTEADGRIFPCANDAKSVVLILQEALEQLGARVFLGHEVLEVFMDQGKFSLKIGVEGAVIFKEYDFLVFASGSIAYPQLGEGKKALGMLEKMGHSLSLLYPALVPLKSSMIPKSFAGIRQKASLYAIITHHQKQRMTPILEGDLLFCDYGISGTAVLDLSSYVSKELLGGKQVHVMIDILPHMSIQQCLEGWANVLKRHPHQSLLSILCGCLPKKMAMGFLKLLKLEANTPADLKVLERILAFLKAWKISITQTKGFEYAEVAGGGIALKDCYLDTLESKICPRLFVIGEALEITGHRGGYNLYLALCSAFLASSHIHASLH